MVYGQQKDYLIPRPSVKVEDNFAVGNLLKCYLEVLGCHILNEGQEELGTLDRLFG